MKPDWELIEEVLGALALILFVVGTIAAAGGWFSWL
jgi:hypothetical protein